MIKNPFLPSIWEERIFKLYLYGENTEPIPVRILLSTAEQSQNENILQDFSSPI